LRLIVGASLAPMLVGALTTSLQAPVAFFVAAFPISDLRAFAMRQAKDRLGIDGTAEAPEPPALHNLQGMTASVIDSLASSGIESPEHLAYADPINLLLRTNLA